MIQRVQTVFLLLAALGNFGLGALPWAANSLSTDAGIFSDGLFSAGDHPLLMALTMAAGTLALIAIGLFKKRKLQIRITAASLVFTLLGAAWAVWLFVESKTDATLQAGAFLVLPIALFALLAIRYIRKDDKLVRSMDRLR